MAGEEAPGLCRMMKKLRQGIPVQRGQGGQAGDGGAVQQASSRRARWRLSRSAGRWKAFIWARSSAAVSPSGSSGNCMAEDWPERDGKGQAASSRGSNGEEERGRDMA